MLARGKYPRKKESLGLTFIIQLLHIDYLLDALEIQNYRKLVRVKVLLFWANLLVLAFRVYLVELKNNFLNKLSQGWYVDFLIDCTQQIYWWCWVWVSMGWNFVYSELIWSDLVLKFAFWRCVFYSYINVRHHQDLHVWSWWCWVYF